MLAIYRHRNMEYAKGWNRIGTCPFTICIARLYIHTDIRSWSEELLSRMKVGNGRISVLVQYRWPKNFGFEKVGVFILTFGFLRLVWFI